MLPPLVAVVGPTASGKTALAHRLARRFGPALLVSVDSRQVYRGMDVATGKEGDPARVHLPGMGGIPSRWLPGGIHQVALDLVEPGERWTAAKHAAYCRHALAACARAERVPILVGGTAMYVEAILRGYDFGDAVRPPAPARFLVLAPRLTRDALRARIRERVDAWVATGRLQEEVALLRERVPADSEAWTGIGYHEFSAWLDGDLTLEDATRRVHKRTWDYARRQRTYLRNRLPETRYVTPDEAESAVAEFLAAPTDAPAGAAAP